MAQRRFTTMVSHVGKSSLSNTRRFTSSNSTDILFKESEVTKLVTLNRPKQLNSLNHNMVLQYLPKLQEWNNSSKPTVILVHGEIDKAFCAGGDVKAIWEEEEMRRDFFYDEYRMNYAISQLTVPHVALLRGIVMGGGVGISIHGSHRVATNNSMFAMPETAIGFVPDVGASWTLPRLLNNNVAFGTFLGMTGYRLKGYDLKAAGIATHFVPLDTMSKIQEELIQLQPHSSKGAHEMVNEVLQQYDHNGEFSLAKHMPLIEECFSKPTVEEIVVALEQHSDSEFAQQILKTLKSMAPLSLKVTQELVKRGATLTDYKDAFKMEYNVVQAFMETQPKPSDFFEGVRAVLIDRDNKPKWNHPSIEQAPLSEALNYFDKPHGSRGVWQP